MSRNDIHPSHHKSLIQQTISDKKDKSSVNIESFQYIINFPKPLYFLCFFSYKSKYVNHNQT